VGIAGYYYWRWSRSTAGATAGVVRLRAAGVLTGARCVTGPILGSGRRKG
jgi:hypothetical protein